MKDKDLVNLIFEWGHLRKIKHEGFRYLGVSDPESVAEHNLHAAQIAYVIAKMEKYKNPLEVVAISVFHEIGESRIGDVHRIGDRYITKDEERAVRDQLEKFDFKNEILKLWEQSENRSTKAGNIAKDADLLQTCFVIRELQEHGHNTGDWIENTRKYLKTESAKSLLDALEKTSPLDWMKDLKTFRNLEKK
ncbi:MAG: HD domain-containing protein [Candidatus Aenigmarchaeota archaeon]|nr:HD domain-containing protein [Candidatus Aenigmarchaeota archaeon]